MLVLARRLPGTARAARRSARAVRAAAVPDERSRFDRRGIRSRHEAPARQLPAGVHAPDDGEQRLQPGAGTSTHDAAARDALAARKRALLLDPPSELGGDILD